MTDPTFRAFLLDFNGTLSDDEGLLYELYAEIAAEAGRPLDEESYRELLAGQTDEEILATWLGDRPDIPEMVRERVRRYVERASDGRTIGAGPAEAVRRFAADGPVAIVSSAFREEVDAVLSGAGLAGVVAQIVTREDVERPKPSPEPYLEALARLGVGPDRAVAFEDTPTGLAAAAAAGVLCVALRGTVPDVLLHPRAALEDGLSGALADRVTSPGWCAHARRVSAATRRASGFTAL